MDIKITTEELRKRKLFVATPCYGGQCMGLYSKACLDLQGICIQYGIEVRFSFIFNESLITRARNYLVDEFLRSGCTHMLFIDADIQFNPQDVIALLALDRDIIGGPYPKKTINWSNIATAVKNHGDNPDFNPQDLDQITGDFVFNPVPGTKSFKITEPVEVMEIGTGFMMVKREVFEKYAEEYPHLHYKPDHVGQANFDGTRYIHAYFDTVIDPQSHRYLSEDYMFCVPSGSIVETEDGPMKMKSLVDNKYSGKVLSLNTDTNQLEWKNVVGWSVRQNGKRNQPDSKKKWVRINTTSDNNTKMKLRCTDDHKIAYFTNVFDSVININYTEAKNLVGKYIVRNVDLKRNLHKENPLFNKDQVSFLIGTLLGDATISKQGQISITHCEKQKDYIQTKQNLFGGKMKDVNGRGFGNGKLQHYLYIPINEQTRKLRDMMYENGKKTVKNIIDMIDDKSLAFWWCDDGSLEKNSNGTTYTGGLSTCSFSYEENLELVKMFSSKFNLNPKIDSKKVTYKGEQREYNVLRFGTEDCKKLSAIIAKYVPECMNYKIVDEHIMIPKETVDNKSLCFAASLVKEVEYLKNDLGKLYDITVEDNHNFVSNGTVVHNCQNARAINLKVWLCPWMKTTHIGTYAFQGDLASVAALSGALR